MSYEERRVKVRDFASLPTSSPLLVEVPGTGDKPRKLHLLAAESLRRMADAIRADLGIELLIASGHRRHRWKSREHYEATLVAKYGSVQKGRALLAFDSPHETGLAIDIGVGGLEPKSATTDAQRATPLHAWLVEHAHKYGWHPYKREPWHWEHPVSAEEFRTGVRDALP